MTPPPVSGRTRLLGGGIVLTGVLMAAVTLWPALASGVAVSSRTLTAGGAGVARCDVDGITVSHNLASGSVVSVNIGAIAAACGTGTLSVTVRGGASFSSGSGAIPPGGGSVAVTLAVPVVVTQAMSTDVSISGP